MSTDAYTITVTREDDHDITVVAWDNDDFSVQCSSFAMTRHKPLYTVNEVVDEMVRQIDIFPEPVESKAYAD